MRERAVSAAVLDEAVPATGEVVADAEQVALIQEHEGETVELVCVGYKWLPGSHIERIMGVRDAAVKA